MRTSLLAFAMFGCGLAPHEPPVSEPTLVFTYPRDRQLDVPVGSRVLVAFSDPIETDPRASCAIVGPAGALAIDVAVIGGGRTVAITSSELAPGATYDVYVGASEPLFHFTTRSERPLAGPPTLIAFDGADPAAPGTFRPVVETSTLQLVFSEPLDPRSVALEPGAIELLDATGTPIPATLLARGIHVAIDPVAPLVAGAGYEVRLGEHLVDLGGEPLAATAVRFTPLASLGRGAIAQTFRTRGPGDPLPAIEHTDTGNAMAVAHPLIGSATAAVRPSAIRTQLGDPAALGGPIAFTIPRGQRFAASGLDIALGGVVPSGLTTGSIQIETLTDASGLIYRADPDGPLLVDLGVDFAVYASDPVGNAVLAQAVLAGQLTGTALADEGVLAIETVGSLSIDLLGLTSAPTNLALDLVSDPDAIVAADTQPPKLLASLPAADAHELAPDDGIELIFDEPIDLASGIALRDSSNRVIATTLESHGSSVVLRPRAPLGDGQDLRVTLDSVRDLAGNALPAMELAIGTLRIAATDAPLAVEAIVPGAPCALAAERCVGAAPTDDPYPAAELPGDQSIEIVFDQPVRAPSATLGDACGRGSVRIERVDDRGVCTGAVRGTLIRRTRSLAFVPDQPWEPGAHYRLQLVSGPDAACGPGELCGANGVAASFDPLRGTTGRAAGGADLVVDFAGVPARSRTRLVATASPYADANGSGRLDAGELHVDTNRVALRIAGTSGLIGFANFQGADCLPETPATEACMYVAGAIPAELGETRNHCELPDGTAAASCVVVAMTPQIMYSTAIAMTAGALGIGITADTGTSILRMRDRASGLEGYIVDRGGVPTMIAALDLYMDAPDMSLPLAQHDMHSKPLSVLLSGPVQFRADGRLALTLANLAEVPISIGIQAPLGITGAVDVVVPAGEMRLQLLTHAQRGSLP